MDQVRHPVQIHNFPHNYDSDPSSTNEWEEFVVNIYFGDIGEIEAHAKPSRGIPEEHLRKAWRIDLESDQNTLIAITQRSVSIDNTKLTRDFGTGDRMLRYKRMYKFLFMDTLFATKKYGKSSQSDTCCKLLLTNKVFSMLCL